ncbi:hypothetical protein EXIGLDRAFT_621204, partial [Exidia glandulosa HHB12029]
WAIHIMLDMPCATIGRAAIIGDALHAAETHFGSGAGQAMEDAYVLGRLLTHPSITRENIPQALTAYERVRLGPSTALVARTRYMSELYEFLDENNLPDGRHAVMRETDDAATGVRDEGDDWTTRWGKTVTKQWVWQWDGTPETWWKEAETELNKLLA